MNVTAAGDSWRLSPGGLLSAAGQETMARGGEAITDEYQRLTEDLPEYERFLLNAQHARAAKHKKAPRKVKHAE